MENLVKSFSYAFSGIFYAVRNERNLRIHLSATVLVSEFAGLYGLSRTGYALLLILCGAVIAAELVNTAIEAVVDMDSPEYSPLAKIAKDVAAGAVLVLAIAAIGVAVILFSDIDKLSAAVKLLLEKPVLILLLLMEIILLFLFIFCMKPKKKTKEKQK